MHGPGQLSLVLAQRRVNQQPIINIRQLSKAANVNRYMLDNLDKGSLHLVHIQNLKTIGTVLQLTSLNQLLGVQKARKFESPRTRPLTEAANAYSLSMRQLAQKMGVSRQSLLNIDNGTATYIHIDHLRQLCGILELSVDDIVQYYPLTQDGRV